MTGKNGEMEGSPRSPLVFQAAEKKEAEGEEEAEE